MSRKINALALALVAIAAMSMAAAVSAQATELHATTPAGQQAVIHGEPTPGTQHIFVTNAGQVKCSQSTFDGTTSPTADQLTITPTYTGCQAFGQAQVTDTNGCKFTLTGTDTKGITYPNTTVNVDITGCTSGKSIEITTGICRMTVPQQHHLGHIIFTNIATPPHDAHANLTVTGIVYQSDGPLCPTMPTGQQLANGTYTGNGAFQAYEIIGTHQVTKHGHQYNEHTRGKALGLLAT